MRCTIGTRPFLAATFTVLATLSLGAVPAASRADDPPKTLKERLSDKASDEQRVDNCRVPVDRRGSKPRPGCRTSPVKSAPKRPSDQAG